MRKILFTLISVVALGALVACGGSSSSNNTVTPPSGPSGGNPAGFSNASLSGPYVFALNGITESNSFAVVGTFNANGDGTISSGTRDTVNDGGGQTLAEGITGTYSVNGDGRGELVLNGQSGQAIYLFVLSSTSAGKLFQYSNIADGVGTIEAQTGTAAAAGTYVVRFDGEDVNRNVYGAIGGVTVNGGSIAGTIDENDAGTFSQELSATGSIGSFNGSRANANIITPTGTTNTATHHYVVYYVTANRLEFVSTDTNFWLHGHADLQTNTNPNNGNQVINLSGNDSIGLVEEIGRFYLDGSGNVTNGFGDYNEAGTFYSNIPLSNNSTYAYSPGFTGRWSATLNLSGAASIVNQNLVGWQVSPAQSTVLVTYASNPSWTSANPGSQYGILETGEMRGQTLLPSNASITGNYAQYFAGDDASLGNFESTGQYSADANGGLSGTIDFQSDAQGLTENSPQTSSYTVDPTYGRGSGNVSSVPVIFYTVDADTIYMISSSASSAYQGTMTKQP